MTVRVRGSFPVSKLTFSRCVFSISWYVQIYAACLDMYFHRHARSVAITPDKLPARVNIELVVRLQEVIEPGIFTPRGVYDGRKNLFSTRRYPFENDTRTVSMIPDISCLVFSIESTSSMSHPNPYLLRTRQGTPSDQRRGKAPKSTRSS